MNPQDLAETLLAQRDTDATLNQCQAALEAAGFLIEHHKKADALIAARGKNGPVLSGHIDVVDPGEDWTKPPFGQSFTNDRLYGRGACDMRGPIAAMLAAASKTDAPARVVLTTDEETTMHGARALVSEDPFQDAPLIIVGEPTGLNVASAGKGLLWATLTAVGDRGHASTPRGPKGRGASAPERLIDTLEGFPTRPLELEHPTLGPATAALSGLESEATAFNVLAGQATARIDCRFPPPAMPEDVLASLRRKFGLPQEGVELESVKEEPAFLGADDAVPRVLSALNEIGIDAEEQGVMFASEAGHWQRVAPTVICGPGSIERAHAPDEYITKTELEEGQRAYRALLDAFAP